MKIIYLSLLLLTILNKSMAQNLDKELVVNYKDFPQFEDSLNISNCTTLYIKNDSWLVFPLLNDQIVPENGVIIDIPDWINKFENLSSLNLLNLYVYEFPDEIFLIKHLSTLRVSFPKDCDMDKITSQLKRITSLKVLNISGSAINIRQFKKLKLEIPNIKVFCSEFDLR